MKSNLYGCMLKRWYFLVGIAVFILLLGGYQLDWKAIFLWWSGTAKPHESLRNLGLIVAAVAGVGLGTWRSIVAADQARTTHQGHITDRFSKAVEHLGSDNVTSRIGGIYALKRIAKDSMERDHISVMDVLTNFIRYSPHMEKQREALLSAQRRDFYDVRIKDDPEFAYENEQPAAPRLIECPDIIAAIETIRTRSEIQKTFEAQQDYFPSLKNADFSYLLLNDVDLSGFRLDGVNFKDANITGINLMNVDLSGYDLVGIDFSGAILSGINLSDSDLEGANLSGVKLNNAKLERTNLSKGNLSDADITGADLTQANLQYVDFTDANLSDANLTNADLLGAVLINTDLSCANLSGANLNGTNVARKDTSLFGVMQERGISFQEWDRWRNEPDLSNSFTRLGRPPRNLLEGIEPPPVREET